MPNFRPDADVDYTGLIAGESASTVVNKANDGKSAFDDTVNFRNTSALSGTVTPTGITVTMAKNGSRRVQLTWTISLGSPKPDRIYVFLTETDGAAPVPTVANSDKIVELNVSATKYTWTGLSPEKRYSFGIALGKLNSDNTVSLSTIQAPTTSPDWVDISAETVTIDGTVTFAGGSVTATDVAQGVTDFNAGNNRNTNAIANAPVIPADGTAIDHVSNSDGSADISFEWTWAGTEGTIDGFMIYVYSAASTGAYTWGSSAVSETIYTVPANKRVFAIYGAVANRHYHFGIRAYRKVDNAVANTGSAINGIVANPLMSAQPVKPTHASEVNGYQPAANLSFSGTLSGTVGSVATGNVNVWSAIGGTGKPEDNATLGATAGTNLKDQSGNQVSASTDGSPSTIFIKQNTIKIYDASGVLRVKIGNLAG